MMTIVIDRANHLQGKSGREVDSTLTAVCTQQSNMAPAARKQCIESLHLHDEGRARL